MVLKTSELTGQQILFDEGPHEYFTLDGVKLLSVSSLLNKYTPQFDVDGKIIAKCATRNKISIEEMRAEWDKIADDAKERGNKFHNEIEEFIKNGNITEGINNFYIKKFSKIKFKGQLFSEQIAYTLKHKISGTVDLIELLPDDHINIFDFKTNKALEKKAKFGKRMIYPVNHLPYCNFMVYTLQLSLYALILEEFGLWVNKMGIFYINYNEEKLEYHPINFKRYDVLSILKDHEVNEMLTFD